MRKLCAIAVLAAAHVAAAGMFGEPVSADSTVPPERRVYLKGAGLERLSLEDVHSKGRIFLPQPGGWCNLCDRVGAFDPASLDYLNLDYNSLSDVSVLPAFTGLKWLRLNENRLSALPDLSALKSLRRIYLRDNAFKSVPETLKDLPSLDTIDLSGNADIKTVPDWLAAKEGLAHLNFSRTGIAGLPADLSAWRSLKSLQLGSLQIPLEEMKRIRSSLPDTAVVF
ncbi:MAG: hypothetical protein K6F50_07460 [Kiritimatiellae bacterium]|nr:hypothetical protein [Kiritimatiellia bacterium]